MISRTSLAVIWPFFCALISRPACFHCAPIGRPVWKEKRVDSMQIARPGIHKACAGEPMWLKLKFRMLTLFDSSKAQSRCLLFAVVIWLALVSRGSATVTVGGLRCDYAVNPLGVDSPNPRLFWKLESRERGQKQTAWQILAASSAKNLAADNGDLWDSGKVDSGETIQIPYGGKELKSAQQVFWKVRAWDAGGKVSAWSQPATWTMGVLADSDWRAKWISAPDTNFETLLLRREFTVKPGLKRALVNICGLGQYELSLDGKKAGNDLLAPGWSKYDRTCLYDTRDVTRLLRPGKNAVGIFLGCGMYKVHDAAPKRFLPPGHV